MDRASDGRAAPGALAAELARHGVPVVQEREVDTPAQAAAAAAELGFPVVLKARGLDHKSDDGGVALGLADAAAVQAAGDDMVARLGTDAAPFVVQQMAAGFELLIGVRRGGPTGATVVVGHGGIHVEVWHDLAEAALPLPAGEARRLVERLRCYPLLTGHRGSPAHDVDAAVAAVEAVAAFAQAHPEVAELDLNPVLVGAPGAGALAVDVRATIATPDAGPDRAIASVEAVGRLLDPRHIVVVGVSDDPTKTGSRILRNVESHGFTGRIDIVHPAGGEVGGRVRYRSLAEVPGTPDLVSVAVPAGAAVEVTRQAVEKGAGAVVVHGGGFREAGGAGAELQDQLVAAAAGGDVALLGPNSMGVVCPGTGVAASLSGGLSVAPLLAGDVAVVSTSGALGSCLATRLMDAGIGLSRWVHVGNEAGVDLAAALEWLATDDQTKVVAVIAEHLTDGDRMQVAGKALQAAGKPVFAYGLARTSMGHDAVKSHTGAMVGPFAIREAVLRAAGIVSIESLRMLEDVVGLASRVGLPRGRRVGAITASGGACTIIADTCSDTGLELPTLAPATIERLAELVPGFAGVVNPIDMTAELLRDPERFGDAIGALVQDPGLDLVVVQFTTNADPGADATARAVIAVSETSPIPIYVSRFGAANTAPKALARYREARMPLLDAPDRAVEVVAALVRAAEIVGRS